MNALKTSVHLAAALYDAGMSENEAISLAKQMWDGPDSARENLAHYAARRRDHAKRLEAEAFVVDQVLAGVIPSKPAQYPSVATESGFAVAHHAPEVKA